jgi:hypothetical protein
MARWRAEAIERLPEFRDLIESSERVMALWIELLMAFESAYREEPQNESLITRIYSYARWCEIAPRDNDPGCDPLTAVCVAFYEHIPTIKQARNDMPRWFKRAEVLAARQVFSRHISEQAFEDLVTRWA